MSSEQIKMFLVLGVLLFLILGLIQDKIRTHFLFLGSCLFLMVTRILSPSEFLSSFANESIATIFFLILITVGISKNFNIIKFFDRFFTQTKRPRFFLLQLNSMVAFLSSFLNNTPIVAMLIPYTIKWSRKMGLSPSRFLIPLSYSAITGGMITIIGTSTNLILNGFLEYNNLPVFNFFDFLVPGLFVSIAGIIFTSLFGHYFLKDRIEPLENLKTNIKEYLVELTLNKDSKQCGNTVQQAGLRNLSGVYLVEILRNNKIISPVEPNEVLMPNDRLFFAGDTSSVVEIVKDDSGFQFPKTQQFNIGGEQQIIEVLIPYNSSLSGKTLKESNFRETYDAAVIAIHRNAERLRGKLGDIKLSHGDLMMLTIGNEFRKSLSNNTDIYILETKGDLRKPQKKQIQLLVLTAITSITLLLLGYISFFLAVLVILSAFFVLKLLNKKDVLNNLNLELFAVLGSSIAIGSAFIESGSAKYFIENALTPLLESNTLIIILSIYFLTVLLTTFVTNAAAISIVFPIVFELSRTVHINPEALYIAIAFGASCSFISPFGYQTNLMVYGPGGYKLKDFVKIGFPMTLIYSIVCLSYIFFHYNIL